MEPYEPQSQDWTDRTQHFFEAHGRWQGWPKESNVPHPSGTSYLQAFTKLDCPSTEKTLEQLIEVLSNHYSPKPSEIMQRYRFYSRTRRTGESVDNYVAALRTLGRHCNFGMTLETMQTDRLACGINHLGIQKKLLGEHDLTFGRALAIAESLKPPKSEFKEGGEVHQLRAIGVATWQTNVDKGVS